MAAAGAEQVILVAASPRAGRPHELSAGRADLRGRAGEQLAAFEAAALRDVLEQFAGRFAGLFVIRPAHNPLGPLDFAGVYDERSDRTYTVRASSSIAATRMPTASSSSRSSAPSGERISPTVRVRDRGPELALSLTA